MIINDDYTALYYPKESVDAAIAKLNAKLAEKESDYKSALKAVSHWHDNYCELQKVVDGLQSKLECKEADTRILKRALWLARAERAKAIKWHEGLERYLQERKKYWPSRFSFMKDDEMYHVWYKCWCEVERKCRAKAKEYE